MNKQFSDAQLDKLMQTLVNDASADESLINDIADSPIIWWSIRKQISHGNRVASSPWPPSVLLRRWLMIGVPVAAGLLIAVAMFMLRPTEVREARINEAAPIAGEARQEIIAGKATEPVVAKAPESIPNGVTRAMPLTEVSAARAVAYRRIRPATTTIAASNKQAEIKTDFIALSYAANPESGQVVRVKVPSSMMVTLGLVASVEKPSSLVDAEVVVGDDGQTHAIRFIRQYRRIRGA